MLFLCLVCSTSCENPLLAEIRGTAALVQKQMESMQKLKEKLERIAKAAEAEGKDTPEPERDQFVAVFDGGSTGTRLNIYKFDSKGLVLKAHVMHNISPGIHQVASPKKVVQELLAQGKSFLKKNGHPPEYSSFPLVFNGTAGLRLVEERKRASVLQEVKQTLESETKKETEVRVIDGKEEGFYAWAALVFVTQIKPKIGIIDLGGGSAQISFEIDSDLSAAAEGVVHGKNKSVLSRSFLGTGLVAGVEQVRKTDSKHVCDVSSPQLDVGLCKAHIKSTLSNLMYKNTGGKEIAPGISQINTIFVSSFISEILRMLQTPEQAKFQDIKNLMAAVCTTQSLKDSAAEEEEAGPNPAGRKKKGPNCISIMYAVMFMEALGVGLFTPIKDSANVPTDISWALGRAISLIQ